MGNPKPRVLMIALDACESTAVGELVGLPERYPGPRAHRLPDGLLLANYSVTSASRIVGPEGVRLTNTAVEARNGVHNGRGFLNARAAEGSNVSIARDELDNVDFAPSLLQLFGLPIDPGFEGKSFLT